MQTIKQLAAEHPGKMPSRSFSHQVVVLMLLVVLVMVVTDGRLVGVLRLHTHTQLIVTSGHGNVNRLARVGSQISGRVRGKEIPIV